jgi:hypothetical protein
MTRRACAIGLVACTLLTAACGKPAQIGPDEEVFAAVDALFTAVTARRADLLDQSAETLRRHHAAGKLPDAAWRELSSIIDVARAGGWQSAAERLYEFMRGQERTGATRPARPGRR